MPFKTADRIFETSVTTGVGDYTLDGAPAGFQPVSVIGVNNLGPFFITEENGSNWEVIIGTYIAGPARLQRTAVLASSNGGAAVNWGVGTKNIRSGMPAWMAVPRKLSKSVAGGAGTTILTQDEQRRAFIEFTGALTGNRVVEVDATEWEWIVLNNTTGAFTLTFRVTGQTGVVLQRARRMKVYCDGVDVRHAQNVLQRKAADVASAATIDLNVDGDLVDVTGNTGITAVTLEEGREVTVRFTGTPTITNGASLVLPGGANIVAEAGDFAVFKGYAGGVVRCADYSSGGLALIAASQAEQEAGSVLSRAVTPGRQHLHQSAAKGWVNFNGTGTIAIRSDYNVVSLVDNAIGDYTVNHDTDFADANYGFSGLCRMVSNGTNICDLSIHSSIDPSASAFRVLITATGGATGGNADSSWIGLSFFGDFA